MEILRPRLAHLLRLLRSTWFVATVLVASLMVGFMLTSIAAIPEAALRETRRFQGQVEPFAEGLNALEVPGAAFRQVGYGYASTDGLECGVGVVFLSESAWAEFQATGRLPSALLNCARTSAVLPGSVAAVYVENQRQTPSNWTFDLALFDVSHPYSIYGLPAVGFLLVAGFGLPVMILRWTSTRWIEARLNEDKKE